MRRADSRITYRMQLRRDGDDRHRTALRRGGPAVAALLEVRRNPSHRAAVIATMRSITMIFGAARRGPARGPAGRHGDRPLPMRCHGDTSRAPGRVAPGVR